MKIISLAVGPIAANCYIVYDEDSKECMIVDPGAEGPKIMAEVYRRHLSVKYIVNTHGHADHIAADGYVKDATGARVLIHELDAPMLTSARDNLSVFIGNAVNEPPADLLLKDGDILDIGGLQFTVIHTPGHTPGGICLLCNGACFSGDTLFENSIGRTDFPGGSSQQLLNSIKTRLLVLDDSIVVYPGHGPTTSIKWEKNNNPFLG